MPQEQQSGDIFRRQFGDGSVDVLGSRYRNHETVLYPFVEKVFSPASEERL